MWNIVWQIQADTMHFCKGQAVQMYLEADFFLISKKVLHALV